MKALSVEARKAIFEKHSSICQDKSSSLFFFFWSEKDFLKEYLQDILFQNAFQAFLLFEKYQRKSD